MDSRETSDSAPLTVTTLKNRADFLRLRRGRKFTTPYFILRYDRADVALAHGCRVGYTVTTKCGNAVVRNRIKRRLRALTRELFPAHAQTGMDYILIALADVKPSAADAPFVDLRAAMLRALAAGNRA
jgi:ribonuclease P protein component